MGEMKIWVVGLGPGSRLELTPRALEAIRDSRVVVGYSRYLEQIDDLLDGKAVISTGMKGEVSRCRAAVERAAGGETVCVVSGGDPGVYGMAGLVLELAAGRGIEVEVVPGVTAATAAAALLGAPIGHDFALVSLSDLLTDWNLICRRLRAAAAADFVLCLYNPSSSSRGHLFREACRILLEERPAGTPCGVVRDAGREGQACRIVSLGSLAETDVDMCTTVVVGNSGTLVLDGKMVTPRGYGREGGR